MSQYIKSIFFRRDRAILTIFVSIVIMSLALIGVTQFVFGAANTITVAIGSNNPSSKTIHNVFEDEVLLQFSVSASGASEAVDQVGITPTYTGTGAASDYQLKFVSDVDGDGIYSDGDSQLLAFTTLTVASGVQQMFDITNLSLGNGTTHNIIVLAQDAATGNPADADTLKLSVLGTGIVTVEGDDSQSGTASGNVHTLEADDPDLSFADGGGNPIASTKGTAQANIAVQQWTITEAVGGTGAGDTILSVGITPSGTMDESTDVTTVEFYIDDGDDSFETDGSDTLLSSTPDTFSANNTKEDFTITGGIKVPQNSTVDIWVVYELAGAASNGETLIQNIVVGTDVTAGSAVALSGDAADVAEGPSATITIDAVQPTVTSATTKDNDNDGEIDRLEVVYTEAVNDANYDAVAVTGYATESGTGTGTDTHTYTLTESGTMDSGAKPALAWTGANAEDAYENSLSTAGAPANASDGAKPVIESVKTYDTDNDGLIDKIDFIWSENIDTNDSALPVAADFPTTLLPDGSTASFAGASFTDPAGATDTVTVTVITGQADIQTDAGSTAISGDLSALWADNDSNAPHATGATANETIIDGASPVIEDVQTRDTDNNGLIDRIDYVWSENVDTDDGVAPVAADLPTTLLPDGSTATFGSAVLTDPAGASTTVQVTVVAGQADIQTDAGSTAISGDLSALWVDAASSPNAAHATGATANETIVDVAAPVIEDVQTRDTDNNGLIDRIDYVWSENVDTDDGVAPVAADLPTTLLPDGSTATFGSAVLTDPAGASTTVQVTVVAGQADIQTDAGSTAISGDLSALWVDAASSPNAAHATGATANETIVDVAAPVIEDVQIRDTGSSPDGLIDRIDFIWSENVDTDDGVAPVAADLPTTLLPDGSTASFAGATISDPAGASATVQVTVITGQSTVNTAAGSTAISGDLSALWVDAASSPNAAHATGATANETIVDNALPFINTVEIRDTDANPDGLIDRIDFVWSEVIDTDDGVAPVAADLPTTLLPDGETADFSGATISDPAGASATVQVTVVSGQLTADTDVGSTAISGDLSSLWADGASNAPDATEGTENETASDKAGPVISSITTSDNDADGTVDTLTLVFSESVDITDTNGPADGFPGLDGITDSCAIANQDLTSNGVSSKAITVSSCTSGDTGITVEASYNSGDGNTNIQDEASTPVEMTDNETVATGVDGAAPVMASATYLDSDANGAVDTIRSTWSENVVMASAGTNDFSITGGDITAVFASAADDAVAGTTLDITVTADANETSHSTAPTITYIPGNGDPIVDAAASPNNATANGAVNVADAAGPVVIVAQTQDTDSDGKVDHLELQFTEAIDDSDINSYNASTDYAPSTLAVANVTTEKVEATEGTCDNDAAEDDAYLCLVFDEDASTCSAADQTGCDTEAVDQDVTWTAGSATIQDTGGNNGPNPTVTETDAALPVTMSRTYTDNGADGSVDRLVMIFSEVVTWNGSELTQFDVVEGDLTGFNGNPTAVAGSGTDTLTLTMAATSNITGASSAPTVAYTQGTAPNRVLDASSNALATYGATSITDAAAPVILSGVYSSNDADGEVDEYVLTVSTDTGLVCTAFDSDGDVSVDVAGTVVLTLDDADGCTDNNTDTFTITTADGATNTTGGAIDPIITYTQPGNGLEDGAGNDVPTKASLSLFDGAVPVILSGVYSSNDVDGEIDQVVFTTSADVGLECDTFTGATDMTVGTAGTVTLVAAVGDTCATNTTSIYTISLDTDGATNTTGGATDPMVTYTQPGNGFEDGQGNDVPTNASLTLSDGAAPYLISATYSDSDSDGLVDRIVSVFSEDTTITMADADWAFTTAGDITAAGDMADAECSGSGGATITCTDAGTGTFSADANETGGSTEPIWAYTNNSNNVTDGTNHTAAFTRTLTDGARPILVSSSPASAGILMPATGNFTLTFSEDLLDASVTTSNIVVTASSGTPTYTVADSSGVVTVTTTGATFSNGVTATVTVGTGVTDAGANTYNTAAAVATEPYSFTALNSSGGGGGGGGGGGASTVSVVSDSVTLTAPNGGEQLTGGEEYTITWTSYNVDNVVLYYSVDGGSNFGLIAAGTDDDGSYSWTVPNIATSQARIKAVGRDSGGGTLATDLSDANFIISTDTELPVEEAPVGTGDVSTTPDGYMGRTEAEASLPDSIDVDYLVRVADDGDPTTDYDTTVYYVGLDAKRHPFINSQVYFTWYENFDTVRTIDTSVLSEMTLGAPVLTRPGTMMVKIQSDPRTFAVEPGDYTIRWVPTEEVAVALFGSTWNQRIMDIEPTYFARFTMGSDMTADLHPAGTVLETGGAKYYFDGTQRRAFASDDAFAANMFQDGYVVADPASTGWLDAALGSAITGFEDTLFSLQR